MQIDFYDAEVIKILETYIKKEDFQVVDATDYYEEVNSKIPFVGSRVNFNLLEKYKTITFGKNESEKILAFIKDIASGIAVKPTERITYIGDNLTNLAYVFPFEYLNEIVIAILDNIPQHHYFLGENLRWVMCVYFENYIEFGNIP